MGNLTNLLGVLIGIVTVMLLLSLVVTALSQTAATMLGLRWRSGRRTIARFVHEELGRSKSNIFTNLKALEAAGLGSGCECLLRNVRIHIRRLFGSRGLRGR